MGVLAVALGSSASQVGYSRLQEVHRGSFSTLPSPTAFSVPVPLNGFNVSIEPLSSLPPTAQDLTCMTNSIQVNYTTGLLWYGGGDNQTLSIIIPNSRSFYRLNASAIVLGGVLQSTGNATEFVPNGTTWPNVMPSDRWAQAIASLVCNSTVPGVGSLLELSFALNSQYFNLSAAPQIPWTTALGTAMGAYSFVAWHTITPQPEVPMTWYGIVQFTPRYGVYVLIANIVVSVITMVVAVRLRMASRLGADFIDATRLLMNPLKKPELFNASLDATINAFANPNMIVRGKSEFMLAEQASLEETSDQ